MINLGLLEFGRRDDLNSLDIIQDIINYAVYAEQYGFKRFWLGEHHLQIPNTSYTNTEVLISVIAGMTENILVGSGGTLISIHSPYIVASNFKFLNNLFYKRIELGLAKGVPENTKIIELCNATLINESPTIVFNKNLEIIVSLLKDELVNLKNSKLILPPYGGETPNLWYLSSSFDYLDVALKYNLNYCVSTFHSQNNYSISLKDLEDYKSFFYNKHFREPLLALSLAFSTEEIKMDPLQSKSVNDSEKFNILYISLEKLSDLIYEYNEKYQITEFILYDTSPTNAMKISNSEKLSKIFNLGSNVK